MSDLLFQIAADAIGLCRRAPAHYPMLKSPGFGEASAGPQVPRSASFLFLLAACGREGRRYAASISGSMLLVLSGRVVSGFWAVAASRNSSLAPFGPLRCKRVGGGIPLRGANTIALF